MISLTLIIINLANTGAACILPKKILLASFLTKLLLNLDGTFWTYHQPILASKTLETPTDDEIAAIMYVMRLSHVVPIIFDNLYFMEVLLGAILFIYLRLQHMWHSLC